MRKGYLTPTELQKLIKAADGERNQLLLTVLTHTGIRVSELISIKVEDINFQEGNILIPHLKSKRDHYRTIEAHPKVLEMIRKYISGTGISGSNRLFPVSRQMVYYIVRDAAEASGFSGYVLSHPGWNNEHCVSPHRLRDAFATNFCRMQAKTIGDVGVLQELLGHARIQTTWKYMKLSGEDVRKGYLKFMDSFMKQEQEPVKAKDVVQEAEEIVRQSK